MSVLLTFPGQGSQQPGMLHQLPDHPEVANCLEEAQRVLGFHPHTLDSAAALASTQAVQLCLLIAGVAMARVLIALGGRVGMVAGLSIGAYPAAVVAGVLDFGDAVRLVAHRGQLMEEAFSHGYSMAAVLGLERHQLEPLIAQVHQDTCPVYLANCNAERQMVVAGADAALTRLMALTLENGASRVERLAVPVPSHTPLLEPAARVMREAFAELGLGRPQMTWLSSSAARALWAPAQIADDLAWNMARQVQWHDTVRLAWERGARLAVEMPSGSVLTGLSRDVFGDDQAVSCSELRLDNLLALMERAQQR